ncbi:hypothetical protein Acsp04_38790 [Actinomadura sp. NBRC 104425]|uniref:hypothetical protein n=1 Tax=Actinomadura sp. NBRC 104425 TaxID=3032204 RepID=UPI0024A5D0E8|nr:hypothetical protein [Actinomadura sp. NBRC 104425]GLZ13644.1 hypothetical protein Acsp04_38790 [Actinomadura sp. NBRC 104425]
MPTLIDRIKRYASGPQGRRLRAKAERYARDSRIQAKVRRLMARLRGGHRH